MLTSTVYTGVGMAKPHHRKKREATATKSYCRTHDEMGHPQSDLAAASFLRDLLGNDFFISVPVIDQIKRRAQQKCSFVASYRDRSLKVQTGYKAKWFHPDPYEYPDMQVPWRLEERETEADVYIQVSWDFTAIMISNMAQIMRNEIRMVKYTRESNTVNEPFYIVPLDQTHMFYKQGGMWWPANIDLNIGQMVMDLKL